MATLAYLDATGRDKINSATFLNTLIDFSEPGLLGVFTDEATISRLERIMAAHRLPAGAGHAPLLRPAAGQRPDLELRGQQLADGRGAAGLRPAQLERRLHPDARRDALVLPAQLLSGEPAGPRRDGARRPAARPVAAVDQDLYFLAAEQDHIAPWRTAYRAPGSRRTGPLRAVQLGPHRRHRQPAQPEVDPPGAARRPARCRPTPTTGSPRPTTHRATWWEDWASWIGDRAGALRQAAADGQPEVPSARRRARARTYARRDRACRLADQNRGSCLHVSPSPRPS